MSLLKHDCIDLVVLLPGVPDRVALLAYDGGEIADAASREKALRQKLTAYSHFVASGQFAAAYPQFVGRDLCIRVVCLNEPTEAMKLVEGVGEAGSQKDFLPVEVATESAFTESLRLSPRRA